MISVEHFSSSTGTIERQVPTSKRTSNVRLGGSLKWRDVALDWLPQVRIEKGDAGQDYLLGGPGVPKDEDDLGTSNLDIAGKVGDEPAMQTGPALDKVKQSKARNIETGSRERATRKRKGEVYMAPQFLPPATELSSRWQLRKHNVQLVIPLTPEEIEADLMAITGRKVPRRSATACRTYQKYPKGEWQTKISK